MASGISAVRYGSFIGTGADIDIRGEVGFRPRSVRIINEGGGPDEGEWVEGMADGSVLKRLAAGALTLVAGPTAGITPLADGFKLGNDADLNVDGELVRWIATE